VSILLNKDSKVLYEYDGVKYLVDNYDTREAPHYPTKYLLYSQTQNKFLCFSWYPCIHHIHIRESIYSGDGQIGMAKRNNVRLLIESYLKDKKEKDLIQLNNDNYNKGGMLEHEWVYCNRRS